MSFEFSETARVFVRMFRAAEALTPHFRLENGTDQPIIAQRPLKMRVPGLPRWCGGHHPVGDTKSGPICLTFNPQLRVEFRGASVTSDAGLLLPRELDKRLGP